MRVGLFPTCTVDALEPGVGLAAAAVLERLGHEVIVPDAPACCGQPAYNAGYWDEAKGVARAFVGVAEGLLDRGAEWVVTPSGSCGAMIARHLPSLTADEEGWPKDGVGAVSARVMELSLFLVHVLGVEDVGAAWHARATFHPSCHGRRGLGVADEPLRLLRHVRGLELVGLPLDEDCCGFGGTFAVKLPDVSTAMADEKLGHAEETGATLLLTNDMGCALHLRGRIGRTGRPLEVRHWVEVLAATEEGGLG